MRVRRSFIPSWPGYRNGLRLAVEGELDDELRSVANRRRHDDLAAVLTNDLLVRQEVRGLYLGAPLVDPNTLKMASRSSAAMPRPLSRTITRTVADGSSHSVETTVLASWASSLASIAFVTILSTAR